MKRLKRIIRKGGIIIDINEIHRIISKYFKNLYFKKLENLEEIDEILNTYDISELNKKYLHNQQIYDKQSDSSSNNESYNEESSGPIKITGEFYTTFKEE